MVNGSPAVFVRQGIFISIDDWGWWAMPGDGF